MKKLLIVLILLPNIVFAQTSLFQGGTGWATSTGGELFMGTTSKLRYTRVPIGTIGTVLQSNGANFNWVATSTLGISGSLSGGTIGFLARWLSATSLGSGLLLDNGTVAGVNATSSTFSFNVQGTSTVLNPFNVASSTGESLFTILANGNVGIGTSTPTAKLEIQDTNRDITSALTNFRIQTTSTQGANVGANILLGGVSTGAVQIDFAGLRGAKENSTDANTAGALGLFTRVNGGAMTERVRIGSTGNVGIGTTTPASRLSVLGNTSIGATYAGIAAPTSGLIVEGNVGIGTTSPVHRLQLGNTTSVSTPSPETISLGGTFNSTAGYNPKLRIWDNGTDFIGLGISAGQLDYTIMLSNGAHVWYTGSSGTVTEKMRITNAGNVGIGAIAPTDRLQVAGNITPSVDNTFGLGSSSLRWSNLFAVNVFATSSIITNATSTSFFATRATTTTIFSTNFAATNASSTNATSSNFFAGNGVITNATTTSFSATRGITTNATSTNFFATNASSTNATTSFLFAGRATTTFLFTTNSSSTNATSSNFFAGNGVITNATNTNLFSTNTVATNSTSTNLGATNLNATNGTISVLSSATATITGLTSTNSTSTNATTTNSFTTNATNTNLFTTNFTFTNATGTNLSISGITTLATTTINGPLTLNGDFIVRTVAYTASTSITINTSTTDIGTIIVAHAITTFNTPTGALYNGKMFELMITATTSRGLAWSNGFASSTDLAIPITVASGTAKAVFEYRTQSNKWELNGYIGGFQD